MGLDMYLTARQYIGHWEHDQKEERDLCAGILKAAGFEPDILTPGSPHLYLELCVAYWRKANAIHGWFVQLSDINS